MIDWQAFKRGEFAVRCDTENKARVFLIDCEEHKIRWVTGEKAAKYFKWDSYKCCYSYQCGLVRDSELSYDKEGIPIIDYEPERAPKTDAQIHHYIADAGKKDEPVSPDQSVKHDAGKPQLTLVPHKIIYGIAAVCGYGISKYGERDSWRRVDKQRYRDALYRHWLAYLAEPDGVDAESGLPHLWHVATNVAFLCELEGAK
jgi:hypothetical protein